MEIPVLIEPIPGHGYRARGGEPLALSAEGPSPEAALARLREQVQARLKNGGHIVPLEVCSVPKHPCAEFVGMFKDDPHIGQWKKSLVEYRRKVDERPELP